MRSIFTATVGLFLLALSGIATAESLQFSGKWRMEITFGNGQSRTVEFTALASGRGSFRVVVPSQFQVAPSGEADGEWAQKDQSVTFSGPVKFPVGNVGIEPGRLVLKGKLQPDGSISGEANFFVAEQTPKDPKGKPSKSGIFKGSRISKAG